MSGERASSDHAELMKRSGWRATFTEKFKWQTDLLVEVFQKADYWFHSASPEKEGLYLEAEGKGKAVTAARAGESLSRLPVRRLKWHHITGTFICFVGESLSVCRLQGSPEIHPYISRITSFSPQPCRTQHCIIQFLTGSEWKCLPNPQIHSNWL